MKWNEVYRQYHLKLSLINTSEKTRGLLKEISEKGRPAVTFNSSRQINVCVIIEKRSPILIISYYSDIEEYRIHYSTQIEKKRIEEFFEEDGKTESILLKKVFDAFYKTDEVKNFNGE